MNTMTATEVGSEKLSYLTTLYKQLITILAFFDQFLENAQPVEPVIHNGTQITFIDVTPIKLATAFRELARAYANDLESQIRTCKKNPNYTCIYHRHDLISPIMAMLRQVTGQGVVDLPEMAEMADEVEMMAEELESIQESKNEISEVIKIAKGCKDLESFIKKMKETAK